MFHCLPDSAWADGNLAEAARQLGKLVEHKSKSTQPRSTTTWGALYHRVVKFQVTDTNANLTTALNSVPDVLAAVVHVRVRGRISVRLGNDAGPVAVDAAAAVAQGVLVLRVENLPVNENIYFT